MVAGKARTASLGLNPAERCKTGAVDVQRRAPPAASLAAERAPDYHTNYDNQCYLIKGG